MVQFLADLDDDGDSRTFRARTILDLGCGNGSLLRAVRDELLEEGDAPEEEENGDDSAAAKKKQPLRLLGVDYSEASVKLARSIEADNENKDDGGVLITYAVWDMLQGSAADLVEKQDGEVEEKEKEEDAACWDLVLDKGTFDAISLGNSSGGQGGGVESRYRAQVLNLLRPGGRFLITSCNWTETELCAWMTGSREGEGADDGSGESAWLVKVGRVAYPSFQFGGVQGQAVCTVYFEKRVRDAP